MEVASEDTKALKTDRLNRKMAAYGNIATPIIVAVVGGYFAYSQAQIQQEMKGNELLVSSDISEKNRWLEQAKLSREFMDDILSNDTTRSIMALEIIAHADPNLGSKLAGLLSKSSTSKMRGFAGEKKQELREVLIRQLIHNEKSVRWNAAEGLLSYSSDPDLIKNLIDFAYEDADAKSKSGGENWRIFNVMTVLLDLARGKQAIVFQHKSEISSYIDWATAHDNRTQAMANELKGRIQ